MTDAPLSSAKLKLQNELTRQEQVKAEREEARRLELERTAKLRAQRLANETAESDTDAKAAEKETMPDTAPGDLSRRLPQAHRQ